MRQRQPQRRAIRHRIFRRSGLERTPSGFAGRYARIPFAAANLVKLPDDVSDDQAIPLSDIFPTGYFGAHLSGVEAGKSLAVFGCGPVGECAILSAQMRGAGRIFAVDCIPNRLERARALGAEVINYSKEDPVATIFSLTGGVGADCAIDAVGVDANRAHSGPARASSEVEKNFGQEQKLVAPKTHPHHGNWHPGDGPSQVLLWATAALAKAGTLAILGVYPPTAQTFPIGAAMFRNLTIRLGNCNHRRYLPYLVEQVRMRRLDPARILTQQEPLSSALDAYAAFDRREAGWVKVNLEPQNSRFAA